MMINYGLLLNKLLTRLRLEARIGSPALSFSINVSAVMNEDDSCSLYAKW